MGDRNVKKGKSEGKVGYLYRVKRKGYERAAEELKKQIKVKAATLKRYTNKVKQYRQITLFQHNQSKFFQ